MKIQVLQPKINKNICKAKAFTKVSKVTVVLIKGKPQGVEWILKRAFQCPHMIDVPLLFTLGTCSLQPQIYTPACALF